MKIKRFIVTFVEYGDSVDGKPRVLGLYKDHAIAMYEMHADARRFYLHNDLDSIGLYLDSASAGRTDETGCEWRIDEVDIEFDPDEVKEDGGGSCGVEQ